MAASRIDGRSTPLMSNPLYILPYGYSPCTYIKWVWVALKRIVWSNPEASIPFRYILPVRPPTAASKINSITSYVRSLHL